MDLALSPEHEAFRKRVRAWLKTHLPKREADDSMREYGNPKRVQRLKAWQRTLYDGGFVAMGWPKEYGGQGVGVMEQTIVNQELVLARAPQQIGMMGVQMVGPTLIQFGTDEQKQRYLPRILSAEDIWCQLFSEPGSGSDVAGAVTRAEFRGNQWVVNGQKVWTTSAHKAHWGLLLARTDWDQRKHQGLSYFIIDMNQPGVTVQPLRQMNGYASFNQVFMTDAKVEPEFLVSEVGNGWAVTTTTLMHERRGADGLRSWAIPSDKPGRDYDEEREEIRTTMEPYKWYPQRAGRVDLILERARATGKINDPVLRQEIAKVLVMSKAAEWTARRARTAQERVGRKVRKVL